jgi:hypothetical protein
VQAKELKGLKMRGYHGTGLAFGKATGLYPDDSTRPGLCSAGLGCLLDGFSIVVITLPIALPMISAAGFDSIWFGIYLILMVEVSQITPPVGSNLFVIQGLTKEPIMRIDRHAVLLSHTTDHGHYYGVFADCTLLAAADGW